MDNRNENDAFIPSVQIDDQKQPMKRGAAEEAVQAQPQSTVSVHGNQASINSLQAGSYQPIFPSGYGQYFAAASPQVIAVLLVCYLR